MRAVDAFRREVSLVPFGDGTTIPGYPARVGVPTEDYWAVSATAVSSFETTTLAVAAGDLVAVMAYTAHGVTTPVPTITISDTISGIGTWDEVSTNIGGTFSGQTRGVKTKLFVAPCTATSSGTITVADLLSADMVHASISVLVLDSAVYKAGSLAAAWSDPPDTGPQSVTLTLGTTVTATERVVCFNVVDEWNNSNLNTKVMAPGVSLYDDREIETGTDVRAITSAQHYLGDTDNTPGWVRSGTTASMGGEEWWHLMTGFAAQYAVPGGGYQVARRRHNHTRTRVPTHRAGHY